MGHGTHDARFRAEAELHEGSQDAAEEGGIGPDDVEVRVGSDGVEGGADHGAPPAHGSNRVGPDEVDPDYGERGAGG